MEKSLLDYKVAVIKIRSMLESAIEAYTSKDEFKMNYKINEALVAIDDLIGKVKELDSNDNKSGEEPMTFTDWYESVYEEKWNENYALLSGSDTQWAEEYKSYCKENNVDPIWNG